MLFSNVQKVHFNFTKKKLHKQKIQVKLGWKKYLVSTCTQTHVISPFKCAILLFTSDVVNNEMVSDFQDFFPKTGSM